MQLVLLRHGIAMNRDSWDPRADRDRPLTPNGVERTRAVARALKSLKLGPDLILTSPYLRARQTAEIVGDAFNIPDNVQVSEALAPGATVPQVIRELQSRHTANSRVLGVGHEPGLSRLASFLISGRADADLTLKKAGLIVLDLQTVSAGRCASLEWLVPPRVLVRIA